MPLFKMLNACLFLSRVRPNLKRSLQNSLILKVIRKSLIIVYELSKSKRTSQKNISFQSFSIASGLPESVCKQSVLCNAEQFIAGVF
jgi:hypothetical protein